MMDHNENTLRAAIKSLRDTVAPAVDPTDPQANEQLRLTIDFLEFLRTRVYDVHPRSRYELGRQIGVAELLLDDARAVSERAGDELATALAEATERYSDPATHTRDLQGASARLWRAVRGTVREARAAVPELRARISNTVLSGVEPLIEMESAWYRPFGFEPDPDAVTDLGELLPSGASRT